MEGQTVEAPPRHGQRSDMEVNKLFESFKGSASNTLYLHLQRVLFTDILRKMITALQTRISEDPACAGPICSVAAQLAIVEQREKREQKQQQQQGQCIQA